MHLLRKTFRYRYLIQKGAEFLNISDNFAMYNVAKAVNFLSHRGHIISLELALKHRDRSTEKNYKNYFKYIYCEDIYT